MQFILEYKWWILIGLEVLAWIFTFFMFYARYGMKSNFWFKVGVIMFTITGVIPQVIIGFLNFISKWEIDWFTLIIVVLIIYGLTFGRKEVKKLDAWMQKKFSQKQKA